MTGKRRDAYKVTMTPTADGLGGVTETQSKELIEARFGTMSATMSRQVYGLDDRQSYTMKTKENLSLGSYVEVDGILYQINVKYQSTVKPSLYFYDLEESK